MTEAVIPDPGAGPGPSPRPHAVPASRPRGGRPASPDVPDPRVLAALAAAHGGTGGWTPRPVASGTPGRVWRLHPAAPDSGPERYLKLDPGPAEAAVLTAACDLGLPAPRIASWAPHAGGPAPIVSLGAPHPGSAHDVSLLCLEALSGRPLAEHLHAGGAIPIAAWAEAIARVHMVPTPTVRAALPDLPAAPPPTRWCAERLPHLLAEAGRLAAADGAPLLTAAGERLAGLAGTTPAEPVLCHGDWSAEHVLVRRGAISGVADWEHAHLAPAAYDLASAVLGLFVRGVSVRAALALGRTLAAAYAAVIGGSPPPLTFAVGAQALERAVAAASRRVAGTAGVEVGSWVGFLGVCLGA